MRDPATPGASLRRTVGLAATSWLEPSPAASRLVFRGDADARARAGQAFGVMFPETACRAASDGTRAVLWLGPDEHLLLAPDGHLEAITATIERALGDHAHSLVDVGHRQVGISVHGPRAQWLLEAQCPLPLHLGDFPVGMCTRTLFGKAEIVLWRPAEHAFRIEVWRSFASYVVDLLREIDREP
jgi:sarcosine oxidase, subunit gamma